MTKHCLTIMLALLMVCGFTSLQANGTVEGTVWNDMDGNGLQDGGELGLGQVWVQIETAAGGWVTGGYTAMSGDYSFSGVAAGTYRVKVGNPGNGFYQTAQNAGNDNNDSDVDQYGFSDQFTLASGQTMDIDAGFTTGGGCFTPVTATTSNVQCVNGSFTFDITATGGTSFGGQSWGWDYGSLTMQPYGTAVSVGPFPANGSATVTINDHDNPACTATVTVAPPAGCNGGGGTPSLTINDVTVNEDAGTASLQICASSTSNSAITVSYATSNGTASSGSDYLSGNGTATIPAGQTCTTVTINIVDDSSDEPTEAFNVNLSNPNGATIADGTGTVTILDNDGGGGNPDCSTITFSGDNGKITVGNLNAPIVAVQVFDGTTWQTVASCWDNDCNAPTYMTDPLPAGLYYVKVDYYTAGWQPICTVSNEPVTVGGGGGCDNVTDGGMIAGAQSVCPGTAPATLTSVSLPSGGSGALEYIWLQSTSSCPTNVNQAIAGATSSTYTPPVLSQTTWYVRCSRRAGCTVWTAGESNCVEVTVKSANDPSCSTPCDNVTDGGTIAGVQTICPNTAPSAITSASAPSGGSGALEYIWLQSTSSCPTSVNQAIPGATGASYTPPALSQTTWYVRCSRRAGCTVWTAGESNCVEITVDPNGAGCGGGNPDCNTITFSGDNGKITVGNLDAPIVAVQVFNSNWQTVESCWDAGCTAPTYMTGSLAPGTYYVKVDYYTSGWQSICSVNNEPVTVGGGGGVPSLSINDITVNENVGTASLQICASSASTSAITVSYTTSDGSASNGSDYTSGSGTATIAAGQTCTTVTIPIVDDNNNEPTEVFNVDLSNPSGATIADNRGTVTINDDDQGGGGHDCNTVTFSGDNGKISVGNLSAPIVAVQVFNSAWQTVESCWDAACTAPMYMTGPLTDGTYYVKVDYYTANWQPICTKTEPVTVTGGGGGGNLTISCPVDMSVTAPYGSSGTTVNYATPTANSTCAIGSVSLTRTSGPASGSNFPIGTTQVCYEATDGCGNVESCCFNVTVTEGNPSGNLTITCPVDMSVTAPYGQNSMTVNYSTPTTNSTCPTGSVSLTRTSGPASGSSFPVGTTEVCYEATDGCGNVESCCFNVTVNAGQPDCDITRNVTNSKTNCGSGSDYGLYFGANWPGGGTASRRFTLSNATFVENADGTAKLTAHATNSELSNIRFDVDVDFCGRTFSAPTGSPKSGSCYNNSGNGYYYYTTMCGTLTGTNGANGIEIQVTRKDEAFQVGTGANLNDENDFGASAWFHSFVTQNSNNVNLTAADGDFNFRLSGTPTAPACGTGTANCNSIACYTPPAFPDPNKCYKIENVASGRVLDADYHPWLKQYTHDATSSQRWKFESAGGNYFYIVSQFSSHPGHVIDIQNGSTSNGARADIIAPTGDDCTKYELRDAGSGRYYLVAKHSGKGLKLEHNPGGNGTNIIQSTISSSNNHQKWRIIEINCNNGLVAQNSTLGLSAQRVGSAAKLTWTNNTGAQNDVFVIERSQDKQDWRPIETMGAAGNADEILYFQTMDNKPYKGENYYRIKLVQLDGSVLYSEAQKVMMPSVASFNVFPNPAKEMTQLDLVDIEGQAATIVLYNQLGRQVKVVETQSAPALLPIELNGLHNGFYLIEVITEEGLRRSVKLMVETKQ